jgi:hypothetical protein
MITRPSPKQPEQEANMAETQYNAFAPQNENPEIDARILALVEGLEADGYVIGANREVNRYWVKMAECLTPDHCGLMKLNDALHRSPEMRAALVPWLVRHRPHRDLEERVARAQRAESVTA